MRREPEMRNVNHIHVGCVVAGGVIAAVGQEGHLQSRNKDLHCLAPP